MEVEFMDANNLRKLYGRLRGIKDVISVQPEVPADVGQDYNSTVESISKIVDEDLNSFNLTELPRTYEQTGRQVLGHSHCSLEFR